MSRVAHWSSPAFEAELRDWVEGAVGPVRLEVLKVRPWSTVWRAYAADGLYFAKQNCPGSSFEAGLLDLMGRLAPGGFVPVEAIDADRGLLLTADQGDVLGLDHGDPASWSRLVARWAQVQRALVEHEVALVDVGVPAFPLGDVAELVRERLAPRASAPVPELEESVSALLALDLPQTLVHGDLHGGNLFCAGGRFFDLGDALVAQPMFDLYVPLGLLVDLTGVGRADPSLWQVAEGWIEVWSDVRPATELRAALPHAMRVARVVRHQTWYRSLDGLGRKDLGEYADAAAESLSGLAEPPLLSVR